MGEGTSEHRTAPVDAAAWFFFQGEWNDPRIIDVDPGSIHRWVRVIREWARFELAGDVDATLENVAELVAMEEISQLARALEARVRLDAGDPRSASQLADAALRNLQMKCRLDFEACVWVPLAEWTLARSLGAIEGREAEAQAVLREAAEHAPGTWIATSLTQ